MRKGLETIKKDQSEMKNAISEINNTLEGINTRLDETEDQVSNLEDKVEKNTQVEQQKEKKLQKMRALETFSTIWNETTSAS